MTFRAATFNCGDGPDARKIADIEHLADDFDVSVIGCQEASDRRRALKRFVKRNPSWHVYQPHTPGGAAVPILWDGDEWARLRFRSVLVRRSRSRSRSLSSCCATVRPVAASSS